MCFDTLNSHHNTTNFFIEDTTSGFRNTIDNSILSANRVITIGDNANFTIATKILIMLLVLYKVSH